jgi:3-hydroxyisobutyrate dehydrogenase-like beta-hydroxyacid dehydrogenase
VRLALSAARGVGIDLAQLSASERLYARAESLGFGDSDISAVHEVAVGAKPVGNALNEASSRG